MTLKEIKEKINNIERSAQDPESIQAYCESSEVIIVETSGAPFCIKDEVLEYTPDGDVPECMKDVRGFSIQGEIGLTLQQARKLRDDLTAAIFEAEYEAEIEQFEHGNDWSHCT